MFAIEGEACLGDLLLLITARRYIQNSVRRAINQPRGTTNGRKDCQRSCTPCPPGRCSGDEGSAGDDDVCGSAQAGCFIGVARGFWGLMKVMQSCHVIAGGWGDILITLYLISIFGVNRFWFRRCLTADVGCWFGWTNVFCLQCLRLIWKRGSFSEFCVAAVD